MLKDTLNQLEQQVRDSASLAEGRKVELLDLIVELRKEVKTLEKEHADKAQQLVQQTHDTMQHALSGDAKQVELTSHGLERSIEEFELSHPKFYNAIKALAIRITGLGV